MENLCGRVILTLAIFSCAVQLTMAAVNAIDCATNGDADCVEHSTCVTDGVTKRCQCDSAYKDGNTNPNTCVPKGLGDQCTGPDDCVGVDNSDCSTTCKCSDEFTAINNLCQKGLGNSCTAETDCKAVSNAVCDKDSEVCACKENYKEDNGQCSSAYGLKTILSAPVALMLSFLTIVFTKLHLV